MKKLSEFKNFRGMFEGSALNLLQSECDKELIKLLKKENKKLTLTLKEYIKRVEELEKIQKIKATTKYPDQFWDLKEEM